MEYVLNVISLPHLSLKRVFAPLGNFVLHIHDHFIPHARNNYQPHILGRRNLALMSALVAAVKVFTIATIAIGPVAPAFSSAITQQNIIVLTNQSRIEFGLSALSQNSVLDKAAQAKADDMLQKGYFAHNTPDGHTPWDFITSAGYSYLMAGENLAVNFTEAENVETAWMNSPGHKANILNKNFQEIGIGISEGEYQGHTAIFVVQEFGAPAEQAVTLLDKPTQVQKASVPEPQTSAAPVVKGVSEHTALVDNQPKVSTQPQTITVQSGEIKLEAGKVNIVAQVDGPAVKVVAYFGVQAIMLSPKEQNTWTGQVAVGDLIQSGQTVTIKATGMQGQVTKLQLADFSGGTIQNYNPSGTTPLNYVNFFGHSFNPKVFENRFYLFFIAMVLASLILAIAIKKHIQHLPLIANTSFVVIFAALILWAG